MKTPLRYQITEYDCGTVSLLNAVSYLFKREDIPVELVRAIHMYTIDCYGYTGQKSNEWMPSSSINEMCRWFTNCSLKNDYKINSSYLRGTNVNYENIEKCIRAGGVVFTRIWRKEPQYVIITNINVLNTYIFDSSYAEDEDYKKETDIRVIESKPSEYNRIVRTDKVFSETNSIYSLGKYEDRECILMNKKGKEDL